MEQVEPPGVAGYASENRVFLIDDGERHWCVARYKRQALEVHSQMLGYQTLEDYQHDMGPVSVHLLGPWEQISVSDDDGFTTTKQARNWAAECDIGVFCSTVF